MSLIRCWSNPDGLYVYENTDKHVCIHHSVKPPLSSHCPENFEESIKIPSRVFYIACRRWIKYPNDVKFKGLSIKEVYIHTKDGKEVSNKHDSFKCCKNHEYFIRLKYRGKFVCMWIVTWAYVINQVEKQSKPKRKIGCRFCGDFKK
jgi:hypothetical protein